MIWTHLSAGESRWNHRRLLTDALLFDNLDFNTNVNISSQRLRQWCLNFLQIGQNHLSSSQTFVKIEERSSSFLTYRQHRDKTDSISEHQSFCCIYKEEGKVDQIKALCRPMHFTTAMRYICCSVHNWIICSFQIVQYAQLIIRSSLKCFYLRKPNRLHIYSILPTVRMIFISFFYWKIVLKIISLTCICHFVFMVFTGINLALKIP